MNFLYCERYDENGCKRSIAVYSLPEKDLVYAIGYHFTGTPVLQGHRNDNAPRFETHTLGEKNVWSNYWNLWEKKFRASIFPKIYHLIFQLNDYEAYWIINQESFNILY